MGMQNWHYVNTHCTMFAYACGVGSLQDGIRMVSRGSVNIHAYDDLAFTMACGNGHIELVRFLLSLEPSHGHIDIHAVDDYAFRWACEKGHLEIARFLLGLETSHGPLNHTCQRRWAVSIGM